MIETKRLDETDQLPPQPVCRYLTEGRNEREREIFNFVKFRSLLVEQFCLHRELKIHTLTRSPRFIELLKESKTNIMMIVYFILINFLDFTCLHNYHCQ